MSAKAANTAAPSKRQTHAQLRRLQRLAGAVIMRPLARDWRMQRRWIDHRDMRTVAGEFIKPNDRLTSFERIEIYNRQYWFRLIDCMFDDNPGLLAVLGRPKFSRLVRSYIARHPSRSYTLRNLGRSLVDYIKKNPRLVAPRHELALDMARFEWAQVEAFDNASGRPVSVDDLLGKNLATLRLKLQSCVIPLHLRYPLDDFVLELKQHHLRGEASNAIDEFAGNAKKKKKKTVPLPRRKAVDLVVHRHNNSLYYKRLEPRAFKLICLIRDGKPLGSALAKTFKRPADAALARDWFETWASLGWFTLR